jgi:hypothetical protein
MIVQLSAAAFALLSVLSPAAAQRPVPFETPVVGTTSGTPFVDRCLPNEVMAGIAARVASAEITGIAIICRAVSADGTLGMSQAPHMVHGDSKGVTAVAECPAGQVLRGLAVYVADMVRGVGLYCRVWAGSAFGAAGAASERVGAATVPMSPVTCPPEGSQPAVGIGGAVSTRLVALRLVCDAPRR